jgi:chromate transporter
LRHETDAGDIAGRFSNTGGAMSSLASERSEHGPRIDLSALASAFLKMGLYGFGGVLPFARRVLVEERRWLNEREFAEILGLCQALPGPNVVNASIIIGERFRSLPGSLTCILSLMTAPLVILVMLAGLYAHWAGVHAVDAAIGGMALAAAALIAGNGLKMLRRLKLPARDLAVSAATFAAVGLLHWPLIPVVLAMVVVSFALQGQPSR